MTRLLAVPMVMVAVMVIRDGRPPACERLEPPIEVWGQTLDAAVAKAQARAEKRGADTIYIIKTEPRGGYQYLRAGALKCSTEKP